MDTSSGYIFIFRMTDVSRQCVGDRPVRASVDTLDLRPTLALQPAVDAVHILARPAAGIVGADLDYQRWKTDDDVFCQ